MKAKHVVIAISAGALLFLVYKGFAGNGLMGSANSGLPGNKPVSQYMTDEAKIKLLGEISTLEAKLNGTIATSEDVSNLKMQLQESLKKLNS